MTTLGAFNQLSWAGVGDADECWIIATYWPLVAAGVMPRSQLPTIAEFREAAGRPDKPGPSGGNNSNLVKALNALAPSAEVKKFDGTLSAFSLQLAYGFIASVSLLSSALPKYLQFGFQGAHQVSIFLQSGKFYLMNPLAKEGSSLVQISGADLRRASGALFGDNKIHAVLIRAGAGGGKDAEPPKPAKAKPRQPDDKVYLTPVPVYIKPYASFDFYEERKRKPEVLG